MADRVLFVLGPLLDRAEADEEGLDGADRRHREDRHRDPVHDVAAWSRGISPFGRGAGDRERIVARYGATDRLTARVHEHKVEPVIAREDP